MGMNNIFEMNTVNNVKDDIGTSKVKPTSPVVEVFSALIHGNSTSHIDGRLVDKSVEHIKDLASRALDDDNKAISELNAIQRFTMEPKLLEAIKIFNFMGSYKTVSYDTVPMMRTYKYESVDSRFQAASGDIPFATHRFEEYPIATQTISSGYAFDYRELQSGNFGGTFAEGMSQVQIDMQNKAVAYVIAVMYDAIKNAKGVKHFAENAGITQTSVDDMLKVMRRYGRTNICGDYSVVSQLNDFAGHKTFGSNTIAYGADAVAEEIRKTGLLSFYNGSHVVELPNSLDYNHMNAEKTAYETYLPEGLLFFVPQGKIAPVQIFRRGGVSTMRGDDVITRQRITRFDIEIGAGVAKGMEDQIGLISDTNFEVPSFI